MTVLTVSNAAQFNSAIASAHAGDTIKMAAGDYGDIMIKSKDFAQDITITSADSSHAATFHSLNVYQSSGIDFVGVNVAMTPTATTVAFSDALKIYNSHDVSFTGGSVTAGKAITGVAPTATALDSTGNVVGFDTGKGIDIIGSTKVTIQNVEVDHLAKGIGISTSSDVTIRGNNIHDVRTSTIDAASNTNLVIDSNKMADSHPWDPGNGNGDHADFIHIWTDPNHQTGATTGVTITNNVMSQGTGVAPLGIYLDDNAHSLGFSNVKIEGNVILNGAGQGIRLENTFNSVVDNNTLLQSSGTAKNAPGIMIADGSHDVDVSHNLASYVQNNATGVIAHANIHDNTLVQANDATAAGFYNASVLSHVQTMASTGGVLQYVSQNLSAGAPAVTANVVAATAKTAAVVASSSTVPVAVNSAQASVAVNPMATVDTDVAMKVAAKGVASQILVGGRGDDAVIGGVGNDTLVGGAGNDTMTGNQGNDVMTGGKGADQFVFDAKYPTTGGTDTISDFSTADGDKINVHSIDANINSAVAKPFSFIGTQSFHHTAGELRFEVHGSDLTVQGDVNGDGVSDFSIILKNVSTLHSSDFLF